MAATGANVGVNYPFDKPQAVFSAHDSASYMAVDQWTDRPRIWLAGLGEDESLAARKIYDAVILP
jgi:hypothetical protein